MTEQLKQELRRIKTELIEMERMYAAEKECLINVINVFSVIAEMTSEFTQDSQAIKQLLTADTHCPVNAIADAAARLKKKIFNREFETGRNDTDAAAPEYDNQPVLAACRIIRNIMAALLDDFYPLTGRLKEKAAAVGIRCHPGISENELAASAKDFHEYLAALKHKITEDFRYTSSSFYKLFEDLKGIEKMLAVEFDDGARIREIEQFETQVNLEMGSIVETFNVKNTIQEIKNAVAGKLNNIKRLVARKKKDETLRNRQAQEKIGELKKRIHHAEKDIRKISRKASHFEKSASRDGLTRLYNREALDTKLVQALDSLNSGGESFILILFDVNRLKWINDVHGHVSGDTVLKVVAKCLRETFRDIDFVARYGGDEFVVVVEGISENIAQQRVSAFSQKLKKMRFVTRTTNERVEISASAGFSTARVGDTITELIHRADTVMYAAKKRKSQGSH